MRLLTATIRAKLEANRGTTDAIPCLKLFNPIGAATWLACEIDPDGDTLFGLADLGFGCPEMGYFSLSEIERIHLPYGLKIERDQSFETTRTITQWADKARALESLQTTETIFTGLCAVYSSGEDS